MYQRLGSIVTLTLYVYICMLPHTRHVPSSLLVRGELSPEIALPFYFEARFYKKTRFYHVPTTRVKDHPNPICI